MSIRVACQCGATYDLKDELAGKLVQCPKCGRSLRVPVPGAEQGDPIFGRDKFLLRQKHLALTSEKYFVTDEGGKAILRVERPYHHLRNLAAALAGILAGLVVAAVLVAIAVAFRSEAAHVVFGLLAAVGFLATLLTVAIACSQKRHVTFYPGESGTEAVLRVIQVNKFAPLKARYTVCDAQGTPLALLVKNHIYNLFRKRWHCYGPDGSLVCRAMEDSLILSLLRRLLGPLLGLLRTNFIITTPDGHVLGEFNRNFTILDRYVLDMSEDPQRTIDRRLAIALGVMLDTGERR
jgi:hypothetical protein